MAEMRRFSPVRFGDFLLIFALLGLLFVVLNSRESTKCGDGYELYLSDSLVYKDSFHSVLCTLNVAQNIVVLGVTDSSVQFLQNSCTEKICVHAEPISRTGEEIVCAPNRLVLKIPGERKFDADIIAR